MDIYGSMWGPNEMTCTGNPGIGTGVDRICTRIRQPALVHLRPL